MSRPYLRNGLPSPIGPAIGRLSAAGGQPLVLALANRALQRQIEDGLFDFLSGRVLGVSITDLRVAWRFTFDTDSMRLARATNTPEAVISADSGAFLLLAARRCDPDTLFFRRRLVLEGDTELGLHLKNVLDTLEPGDLPMPLARFLDHAGRIAERWS